MSFCACEIQFLRHIIEATKTAEAQAWRTDVTVRFNNPGNMHHCSVHVHAVLVCSQQSMFFTPLLTNHENQPRYFER